MDINLLVLAVGNSRLATGVFAAGELERVVRHPIADRGQWEEAIQQAWSRIADSAAPAVAAASVNPQVNSLVEDVVQSRTGQGVQWVGRQIEVPIEVCTQNPSETGIDRILNVAAAYEQMGKACIVVDAGTAVTVDCCNDNGDFLGGAIAPGLSMMLDALSQRTAGVGRVSFLPPNGAVGDSTSAAVSQGVYYSIRGLVREIAENYATQLGQWPEIIATGGDAHRLFDGWELIHAISLDLGLYGIALAYTNHHIRHGI
ncbi:MAG: type III pantothenate kinase [Tepidisphaeraceae bacterium]|jgi:type III pantothenate kinase